MISAVDAAAAGDLANQILGTSSATVGRIPVGFANQNWRVRSDWDMPEAWDAAGEWFKLETMLFADLPGTREAFETAYFSVHADEAHWPERAWLVKVIENMNVIANAPNHSADFTASAIERLGSLL